jgi:hypothetical protein
MDLVAATAQPFGIVKGLASTAASIAGPNNAALTAKGKSSLGIRYDDNI